MRPLRMNPLRNATLSAPNAASLHPFLQQHGHAGRLRSGVVGARLNHGFTVRQVEALEPSLQFMPVTVRNVSTQCVGSLTSRDKAQPTAPSRYRNSRTSTMAERNAAALAGWTW